VALDYISRPRVVVQFDFRGAPQRSYWLLIDRSDVSVCLKHPGFEVDVIVTADMMVFYQVWLGRVPLVEAIRKSHIRLDGAPADVRAFRNWFTWSPMAQTVRAALADRSTASNRAIEPESPSREPSAIRMTVRKTAGRLVN
jgi:hypothetical protein